MEDRTSGYDRRRYRSSSACSDSEAERRREDRRKERHQQHGRRDRDVDSGMGFEREGRPDKVGMTSRREIRLDQEKGNSQGRRGNRDRASTGRRHRDDEEADRKRRRSRSPTDEYEIRRLGDGSSKHRSRDDRSPKPHGSRDVVSRPPQDDAPKQAIKKSGPLPSQEASFSMNKDPSMALVPTNDKPLPEKQKPNFAPTGLLAAETNTVANVDGTSIILKYHEPSEARKPPPRDQWKLFVFKGANIVDTVELHARSCWLIGREIAVVDMPAEHPSISKQHAVIQFRYIEKRNEFGEKLGKVRPYLIDLESANGTMLNKELIPGSRYLELRDKDMIQFGDSTREYVLMLPPKD